MIPLRIADLPDGQVYSKSEQQEILMAEKGESGVKVCVTLLAAGFILGPNGASIRQIEAISGAQIYSYNRSCDRILSRPSRQFQIEGPPSVAQHAADIICHAIQLYKDLTEGKLRGRTVKRMHRIDNVLFRYDPPPRTTVPFAAQVEYDGAAGLKMRNHLLQSVATRRSPRSNQEVITSVQKQQLARRAEGAPARTGREAQKVTIALFDLVLALLAAALLAVLAISCHQRTLSIPSVSRTKVEESILSI